MFSIGSFPKQIIKIRHHTKFQLNISRRLKVIQSWNLPRDRHPTSDIRHTTYDIRHQPLANYSPRRNLFRRGQKLFSKQTITPYHTALVSTADGWFKAKLPWLFYRPELIWYLRTNFGTNRNNSRSAFLCITLPIITLVWANCWSTRSMKSK